MAISDAIKLTAGDNKPDILIALKDEFTGKPIDIAASTTTVAVLFRYAGTDQTIATIPCVKTGAAGTVRFNFPGTTLSVPAGLYDGKIEIDFNGEKQSMYDLLKFRVRSA